MVSELGAGPGRPGVSSEVCASTGMTLGKTGCLQNGDGETPMV